MSLMRVGSAACGWDSPNPNAKYRCCRGGAEEPNDGRDQAGGSSSICGIEHPVIPCYAFQESKGEWQGLGCGALLCSSPMRRSACLRRRSPSPRPASCRLSVLVSGEIDAPIRDSEVTLRGRHKAWSGSANVDLLHCEDLHGTKEVCERLVRQGPETALMIRLLDLYDAADLRLPRPTTGRTASRSKPTLFDKPEEAFFAADAGCLPTGAHERRVDRLPRRAPR